MLLQGDETKDNIIRAEQKIKELSQPWLDNAPSHGVKKQLEIYFHDRTKKELLQLGKYQLAQLKDSRQMKRAAISDNMQKNILKKQEGKGTKRTIGAYETKVQPIYK